MQIIHSTCPPPELMRVPRVLLVDDEVMVTRALKRMLGSSMHVTSFTDAKLAVEHLSSNAGDRYELVLCDLMMPETSGMDFYETLGQARPDLVHRVAFMTGGSFTSEATEFLERVGRPVLEKPFNISALRRVIASFGEAR